MRNMGNEIETEEKREKKEGKRRERERESNITAMKHVNGKWKKKYWPRINV